MSLVAVTSDHVRFEQNEVPYVFWIAREYDFACVDAPDDLINFSREAIYAVYAILGIIQCLASVKIHKALHRIER